jgi:putative hydrolase of the HAD superfamily
MSLIPIFDLDDTLYPEITFVESGFQAVACWLELHFGWDTDDNLSFMLDTLKRDGRGAVFDKLLEYRGGFSKDLVRKCIRIYRHHDPAISLYPVAERILAGLKSPLYLVTDGQKIVQKNKIDALEIESRFKKVFLTHRYGTRHAKPSTYCFEIIRRIEGCRWTDMVYIGDNPAKDFVNLTPLGVRTIRVLTGPYRDVIAKPCFDAVYSIESLDQLPAILERLSCGLGRHSRT